MIEIVISTVILLTLLMGFSFGIVSSTSLGKATREQGTACEAARAQLEVIRATTFEDVLKTFDGDDAHFDVPGLTARLDDLDGHVGEIVFPLSEDGELREDLELARLGMPRDLSGEGDVDGLDHAADYRLLPVLVRLQWRGASGNAAFEMVTVLKRMRPL